MQFIQSLLSGLGGILRAAELMPHFDSATGIFCAIAWFATILGMGLFVLSIFSGDSADLSSGEGFDAGIEGGDAGLFSLRAAIGFMLGFGWGGYVAMRGQDSVFIAIFAGLGLGLIMFFLVALVMRFIYRLRVDGTLQSATLVGMHGTVYVTIPPHGEPGGQVQVSHPSQLLTMQAIQMGDTPLATHSRITVLEVSGMTLIVKPQDLGSSAS